MCVAPLEEGSPATPQTRSPLGLAVFPTRLLDGHRAWLYGSAMPSADAPLRLDAARVSSAALERMRHFHPAVVGEVEQAVVDHALVVVGMAQNPFVRRTRNALATAGFDFHYLGYGSYLSEWRKRLAIKLWSGWPTFPQVFVRGVLLGGHDTTVAAIADGSLRRMLDSGK